MATKEPMTGTQKDALQKIRDQKKTSIPQALKDGKIDHGASADRNQGVLDPYEFDKFNAEYHSTKIETERLEGIIKEFLNKNYGGNPDDPRTWEVGFFLEKDPRSQGAKGYQVLQVGMLGETWSDQLQHEAGLKDYEGAVAWYGRGTVERHIICVKTTELAKRQQVAKDKRLEDAMKHRQPTNVAGEETGPLEVTETFKKLPLVPVEGNQKTDEGSAAE